MVNDLITEKGIDNIGTLRQTYAILTRMKLNGAANLFYSKLLSQLEAAYIERMFISAGDVKIIVKDWTQVTVEQGGKSYKLCDLSFSSNGSYLSQTPVSSLKAGDQVILESAQKVRYLQSTSQAVEEAEVCVVKTADGKSFYLAVKGAAKSKIIRTIEELAPNGKIPKGVEFNKWFDELNEEELSKLWSNDKIRDQIEKEIRAPGGLHEWCMVCEVEQFKKWNVKMEDIKAFRTKTTELIGTNPYDGTHFAHSVINESGQTIPGPSSKTFHNELQSLIGTSNNLSDFNAGLSKLITKWKIDPNLLPPFIIK